LGFFRAEQRAISGITFRSYIERRGCHVSKVVPWNGFSSESTAEGWFG
jgi:hypothetical protein